MSQPVEEQPRAVDGKAAQVSSSAAAASAVSTPADATSVSSEVGPSHALLGPFTLREVVFGVGVLVMFIGTLLPFVDGRVLYTTFWSASSLFFTGIGILLPVIALALLAGRRLGSSGLQVGSLSVDQFASVTAVLAATFFFVQTVTAFSVGALLALLGSLVLLAATVLGAFLPRIKDDFIDRPEAAAHPLARPITAAVPRPPKADKPTAETTADHDSSSAATPDSVSEHASPGPGVTGGTGSRPAGADVDRARGASVAGVSGVTHGSGGGAGSAAGSRSPITAGGSNDLPASSKGAASSAGATVSAGVKASAGTKESAGKNASAGTTGQADSAPSRSSAQSVTPSDGGSTGAGTSGSAGTSSEDRGAEQGVASASGSGHVPDTGAADDVDATSGEAVVDETRVHEAVREEPAATTATTATAETAHSNTADSDTADSNRTDSNTARSGAERSRQEPISATRSVDEERVVEAFWFAVGSPRPVFDERTGREIFVLQPGDWEVGIEDRGHDFLVQDKRSGAVGILRDLRNIERAPRD